MLRAAKITSTRARNNILFFSVLNCLCYIAFMMVVKYTGLLHITGLRAVNYVILAILSLLQIRRLIRRFHGYIPFLEALTITFITGTLSFFLFSLFIFGYSFVDPYLNSLFIMDIGDMSRLIPPLLVFFEGSGISIIIGLITMEYAARSASKAARP